MDVRTPRFRSTTALPIVGLAVSVLFHGAVAQDEKKARRATTGPHDVSALLESVRERYVLPALGGAIIEGDRVIALGATGLRKSGAKEKVTTADRWHLGSCGKAMTATLIARLVEKRKLGWETTIGQAFPDLRRSMRPEYVDVTVAQLLSHRGGITGDLVNGYPELWRKVRLYSGAPRNGRRLLVEEVLKLPPAAKPDTKFVYSNAGYAIAGAIAEQATGKAWEDLMKLEIFAPLGMRSAGFGSPKGKEPWGHQEPSRGGRPVAPGPLADNPPAMGPAGTIHCSLEDWARFVALHLGGLTGEKMFLSESSLEMLHTPGADSEYALGWGTPERDWGGGRVLTHVGSNTMWYAVVWAAPKRGFAILVTTNQDGHADACDDAVGVLMKFYREREE